MTAAIVLFAHPSGALAAPASATARGLVVGGARFFPVMLIDQCRAADVARGAGLGVNLVINENCSGSADSQLDTLRDGVLGVLPIELRRTRSEDLVGWTYPDEPDNNGWTPTSLATAHPYPRGNRDGLVTFLTTTGRFYRRAPFGSSKVSLAEFAGFTRLADMAGFDLYPLNACQSDLSAVYDAQRAFVQLASPTPTYQWIETGPIRPTYCGGFSMTPDELIAEVWLAVVGGARGIGYFTHTFTPSDNPFDVTASLQSAMRGTDAVLAAVRPGLLGVTVSSSSNSPVVKVLARSGGNRTYVFAVNTMRSPTKVQMEVPGLGARRMKVVGEHRSVVTQGGALIDHFGALQVHVYVQAR